MTTTHSRTKPRPKSWLQKLTETFVGDGPGRTAAHRALADAHRNRERAHIALLSRHADDGVDQSKLPVVTIEQVRAEDVIVSQPVEHGRVVPIATHEQVRLTFITPSGQVTVETKCLGRFKMKSGGSGTFYGYRLAMPDVVETDDRRLYQRVLVGFDLAPEATLRTLKSPVPIVGVLQDISEKGAKLRCRNADQGIEAGHSAYLHVDLPEPVGRIEALVMVRGVSPPDSKGQRSVHFTFEQPVEALEQFVQEVDRRRAARRR